MWRFKLNWSLAGFLTTFVLMSHSAFAQNSVSTDFVIHYRIEFTLGICFLVLGLSTWLGMNLPMEDKEKDLSKGVKFVTAFIGGILAFSYCLYRDNSLTLLNPLWIFVASITLPVTILNIRTKFKGYTNFIKTPNNGD